MIQTKDVLPLLLEACPSFAVAWKEHEAGGDGDEPLLYVDLGKFADHLVALLAQGTTSEFAMVFAAVERLHLEGDTTVREAATIGLLEGIQNAVLNRGGDPDRFVPYLGPETARWWKRLNQFWSGKRSQV